MNNILLAGGVVVTIAIVASALVLLPGGLESIENIRGMAAGGIKGSDKTKDTGHIWAELKEKGLQGEHYTLNIHGKDHFNKQDCDKAIDEGYGNSIFVPSESDPAVRNQIVMMSGHKKGKWAATADTTYGVRDSCTAAFDGDPAEIVLPPNEKGYYVVARILGKPTDSPSLALEGDLLWVIDENGNDLLVLGLVTDDGFATPSVTLTRTKGNVKMVDITGLFEWSGSVCYFDTTNYCYDELGNYTCEDRSICCIDSDLDGIYETCEEPMVDENGTEYCAEGYNLYTVGCRDYYDEWVFNIGDFVGYMWDTFTDGSFKLANIRFYPVQ